MTKTLRVTPVEARVVSFTESLLHQYGLFGWTVTFDSARNRAGLCNHSKREISYSRVTIKARTWAETENTIKHEVAHAIVGHVHGHDAVWKRTFLLLGGSGERCSDINYDLAEKISKYKAECPKGHRYFKNRAVDDRVRHCSVCPDQPVLDYFEISTGKPMECFKYVPRKRKRKRVTITLPDGRSFPVPSRF